MDDFFKNLNESQKQAVTHGREPLLVVAGAGTGKTTMLAHRVAHLVAQGAVPERILLLTFTRRAATELISRAKHALTQLAAQTPLSAAVSAIWGGTFHAVGTRLLRMYGDTVGLPRGFTIIDRGDAEDLMNAMRGGLIDTKDKRFPKKSTCISVYSRCINSQEPLFKILDKHYPRLSEFQEQLASLFDAYTERKQTDGTLDYDDLLLYWNALLKHPATSEKLRKRFDWVLVDEYQDTNLIQAEIIHGLTPEGEGLTVVGDDAQSIYSFRAATVRNILDLPKTFPKTRVLPLETNYRSTGAILEASNRVVGQLSERFHKNLRTTRHEGVSPRFIRCADEDAQTAFIVETILEHLENGIPLTQQAVLFRSASHSLRLEAELARRRIPYTKYGGLKFTEAAHVKDLLSILRLAENPKDLPAGMRFLNLLPGIGAKKARQLADMLRDTDGNWNAWKSWTPPKAAQKVWLPMVAMMEEITAEKNPLPTQMGRALDFYKPYLAEEYPLDGDSRLRDLEQLVDISAKFKDRQELLADFVLDPPRSSEEFAETPDIDDDYLILSTIHSAKGMEWRTVSVIHASDGNIPSDFATGSKEETDEELRLFYVALTRAKDYLYVTCPMRYYHIGPSWSDAFSRVIPTRFLPPEILKTCFEETYYAGANDSGNDHIRDTLAEEGLDIGAWIRKQTGGLWKK